MSRPEADVQVVEPRARITESCARELNAERKQREEHDRTVGGDDDNNKNGDG